MNTFNTTDRIARPYRFEATIAPTAPFRGTAANPLDSLKEQLLAAELRRTPTPTVTPLLRRAADEAAALAWLTPYPLLILPALLEEKATAARVTAKRQARIRHRSSELLMLAE